MEKLSVMLSARSNRIETLGRLREELVSWGGGVGGGARGARLTLTCAQPGELPQPRQGIAAPSPAVHPKGSGCLPFWRVRKGSMPGPDFPALPAVALGPAVKVHTESGKSSGLHFLP